jgi:hypothetical protein
LQRRTGQTWWAISRLGSAVVFGSLAVVLLVFGRPLIALLAAGMALFEIARDLPASRLGARGWAFIFATCGVWWLLEYWGLSWLVAGLIASILGFVVLRPVELRLTAPPARRLEQFDPAGTDRGEAFASPFDDHDGHMPAELLMHREFHVTMTGRRARLIGWLLRRLGNPG